MMPPQQGKSRKSKIENRNSKIDEVPGAAPRCQPTHSCPFPPLSLVVRRPVVVNSSEKRENPILLPALHIFVQRRINGILLRAVMPQFLGLRNQAVIDGEAGGHGFLVTPHPIRDGW